jgi:DNA-binding transcriptional ArsR family regulator
MPWPGFGIGPARSPDHNGTVPFGPGRPACLNVSPSVPAELAWILDLLTQTARYAEPALAELDASLLPGVKNLRAPVMERARQLWHDARGGCPELLLVADQAGCVWDSDTKRLLAWLTTGGAGRPATDYELLTEPAADRSAIRVRLRRLKQEVETRRTYRDLVADVWRLAGSAWEQRGRAVTVEASARWKSRLEAGTPIEDLMPPRHPLTYADRLGFSEIFDVRGGFALSPLYFCLSGGQAVDLTDYVHVGAPASDLLPVRKVRDAAYVADRLRVLAQPSRVHILIQLLSTPAGVMELARALHMSQPTVSGHVKVLRDAGLIQPRRAANRTVFVGSRKRIERLLEDARATIARWD